MFEPHPFGHLRKEMEADRQAQKELDAELAALRARVAEQAAHIAALEKGTRALLSVTEHGSNEGKVFEARVAAYAGLRFVPSAGDVRA